MGSGWSLLVLVYACMCGLAIREDMNNGSEYKHRCVQEVK